MKFLLKFISLILVLPPGSLLFAASTADTLKVHTRYAVPDGLGNIFIITNQNTLLKVDSNLKTLASQSLIGYGMASSLECDGSMEVVVYCFNTGILVLFDNFLKEINRYDLNTLINPKPTLVCISKTGWWGYDETTLKTTSYQSNFHPSFTMPFQEERPGELIQMAEHKFSKPMFLYSDYSLRISEMPSANNRNFNDYTFMLGSKPCLNYNINELYGFVNDTLQTISFNRPMIENPESRVTQTGLMQIQMIIKSNSIYFVILEDAVIALRKL